MFNLLMIEKIFIMIICNSNIHYIKLILSLKADNKSRLIIFFIFAPNNPVGIK